MFQCKTNRASKVHWPFWIKKSGDDHGLGPGLITGAADDDPNGIAIYSQAGAQFGFSMLLTVGGVILCFTPTDPVKELFWSAVINGVIDMRTTS